MGGPCDFSVSPIPLGTNFGFELGGTGLGIGQGGLGPGLDNKYGIGVTPPPLPVRENSLLLFF